MKTRPAPRALAALAAAALALTAAGAARAEHRVAVLEFTARGFDPAVLARLSDEVRGGVLRAIAEAKREDEFVVLTRENIAIIVDAMRPGRCAEGACEVETARNLGADFVLSGDLLRIDGRMSAVLKLHETARGALLDQRSADAATLTELAPRLAEVGRALGGRLLRQAPTPIAEPRRDLELRAGPPLSAPPAEPATPRPMAPIEAPRPRVTETAPSAIADADALVATEALQPCIAQHRASHPGATGTVVVSWVIRPDGVPEAVTAADVPNGARPLATCLTHAVEGARFPAHSGERRKIEYPVAF